MRQKNTIHFVGRLASALILLIWMLPTNAQNFSPANQADLLLWYRADTLITHTGGFVGAWGDCGGASAENLSQASAAARPQYIADGGPLMNNKPVVRFVDTTVTAADDMLTAPAVTGINDSSLTIFVVADNAGQTSTFPGFFYVNSNFNGFLIVKNAGNGSYIVNNNSTQVSSAANLIPNIGHTYRIYGAVKTWGTSLKGYINGDSVLNSTLAAATGAFNNGTLVIGKANFTQGNTWNGNIAEVLVYRRALGNAERKQVEQYLYDKYAPPVNLGADISQNNSLCPVVLNASKRFVSYLWSNSSTADTLQVTQPGTYWVRTTDVFGRVSSDTIVVSLPVITLNQNDTTICLGSSINIAALPTGGYTYLWNTGSTASTISTSTAGSYSVKVSDSNNCFIYTDTINVSIDSFGVRLSLGNDTSLCAGNQIGLVAPDTGWQNLSFLWQPGNITTATYTVTATGIYSVQAINARGCVGTDNINVNIAGNAPTAAFRVDTVCLGNTFIPVNNSVSNDASPIVAYEWHFGDGGTSNQSSPSYIYINPGNYIVTLKVTTASGCSNTISHTILVKTKPIVAFTSAAIGCISVPVQFTSTSTAAPGSSLVAWQWQFDGNATSSDTNPLYTYASAGNYQPQLTVIDNYGCTAAVSHTLQIVSSAAAPQMPNLIAPANGVTLNQSNVNFTWSGTESGYTLIISQDSMFATSNRYHIQGNSLTLNLSDNTYYWKVRAYGVCNDSIDSGRRMVRIFSPSNQANLLLWYRGDTLITQTGGAVSGWGDCGGTTAENLTQATAALRPTYVADAGPLMNNKPAIRFVDEATASLDDLLLGPTVPGINDSSLTIFVVADNAGQTSTFPGFFYVNSNFNGFLIVKNASTAGYIVNNNSTQVISAANLIPDAGHPFRIYGAVKTWNTSLKGYINGDSVLSSTLAAATGAFNNGALVIGKANFTQGNTWNGNIAEVLVYRRALGNTERKQVEQYLYDKYAPPVNLGPDIVQAYSLCPATLNASKRFVSYLWNDGSMADTLKVSSAGTYWVRTVDVFGRVSSDTISVNLPYKGMPFQDTVLCYGNSVNIQPLLTASPYTFAWSSVQTTPAIEVATEGAYNVTVTDTNGCFVVSETVNVDVDSFGILSLLPTDTVTCIGNLLSIDTNGYTVSNLLWSNGANTHVITVTGSGIYSVTATNTNQCSVTDAVNVTTNGTVPTVDFMYANACLGLPNTFNDISEPVSPDQISTITWNYGDGDNGSGQSVSHTYVAASIYTATLTVVTDSGCTKSISKDVEVFDLPKAVLAQIAPICAQNKAPVVSGAPSTAPFGSNIASWRWIINNNVVSLDDTLSYAFPISGIAPITLAVATNNGCVDTASGYVEVYAPFLADFEYNNVCAGDSTYFLDITPSLSILSRTWNFGDATSAVGTTNPAKRYANPGTYNVTLTVTNAIGCRDTSVKTVIVSSKPTANFTTLSGCEGGFYKPVDASTSLPQDSVNSWQWTIGGFSYNTRAPQRYFANPGSYPVKLVVRTGIGCTDSVTRTAIIYPRPTVNFSYTPLYGDAPLNVTFTNQSTSDSTYFWDFGDGGSAMQKNPSYTYTQNGEYNIKLTVTSPYGCAASRTKPISVIYTELDYAVNEANVQVTPMPDGSSLAQVSLIGSNIGTRIIDHIEYYVTLGGVGVIAEDWEGTLLSGQGLLDTFSAKFVVPSGKGDSYVCVTAMSVNNGQQELRTDNNSQCFGITEGIKLMGPLPNPALNESKLGLILPKHGKVTIDITNMWGQYIIQGLELELPEGRSDYDLPIGQMTAGEYFIRILYNDEKVVRKFVISR